MYGIVIEVHFVELELEWKLGLDFYSLYDWLSLGEERV